MRRSNFTIAKRLIGLIKPLLPIMILAITMGVIGYLCATFITVFGGYALLEVLQMPTLFSIQTIFICIGVFAVLRGILRYTEQASNHYIAFKLLALIRDKVFRALRRLAPAKLEGKDKGNLITIITTDIELLEVFYAHTISPIAIAFIFSLIMVIFISLYHILLGIIALIGYCIVGIIIPLSASKAGKSIGDRYRNQMGDLSSYYLDSLRGLKEIIQYNQGDFRTEQIVKRTESLGQEQEKLKKIEGDVSALTNTVILTISVIMLLASAILFQNQMVGFDGILTSTIAMLSSFGPVVALANLASNLSHTFAAGNRVLDILDEEPITKNITNGAEIAFEGLDFIGTSFWYDEAIILDRITLEVPKNKIIGITGKSGSGKSTLLKLMMRFWDVNKGELRISNKNINTINTHNLRDIESLVTQETHLFHDTIENNIKIGKLDASHEEVIQACKKASLHDFIESLPNGYQTNVGELGETLSGGEKQRIGVARAFLHNAPFILLDEPTSNLDVLNEGIILKSIQQENENRTVVLVSHRKSTMAIADKVYRIENGRRI